MSVNALRTEIAPTDPSRDRPFWALVGVLAVYFLWLSRQLYYPDLVLDYPFLAGDAQDWIANGLFLAGYDVRYSARPPLLPLAAALLERLGLLAWLPIVIQLVVHGSTLALYRLLRRDHAPALTLPIALAWHFNFSWASLSLEIMADVLGACFLGFGVLGARRAFEQPSAWLTAGLWVGFGGLVQPVVLLALPVAALVVFVRCPDARRTRWPLIGAALAVAPVALWYLARLVLVGTTGDVLYQHWSLLRLHLDGLPFYSWAFLSFFGVPAAVAALVGCGWQLRRRGTEPWTLFVLGLFATLLIFFTFLYDFEGKRFLTFPFWLAAVPVAELLAGMPRRARVAALVLVAAGSVMPIPGRGTVPSFAALWPLPSIALYAPSTPNGKGSFVVEPSRLELASRPLAELWTRSVQHEVLAARDRRIETRTLGPRDFQRDVAALYLFDDPAENARRYEIVARLGNLVGRKVFFLPFSELGEVVERLELERVGRFDGKRIYRAKLRGLEGTWLVLAPARGAADQALYRQLKATRKTEAPPPYGLEQARRVARRLGNDFPVVLSNAEVVQSWQVYLPFVIRTPELYFIEPERERGSRKLLESGEVLGRETEEGVTITRYRLLGHVWALIEKDTTR